MTQLALYYVLFLTLPCMHYPLNHPHTSRIRYLNGVPSLLELPVRA